MSRVKRKNRTVKNVREQCKEVKPTWTLSDIHTLTKHLILADYLHYFMAAAERQNECEKCRTRKTNQKLMTKEIIFGLTKLILEYF